MNTKKIIAIFGLLAFLFSCKKENSEDVNQDKIYAEYEIYYDHNADKTYASAVFKFSNALGTNLQLTAPSEVKFNNDLIPYDPTFAYYRKEYAGKIMTGTFTFKDTQGKTFTNTVNFMKTVENPTIDTIAKANSYTYAWVGDSIIANERIDLTMSCVASPAILQYFLQTTVNSKNFVLSQSQLNNLPTGLANCDLSRHCETTASAVTSAGGKIKSKYRALNKTVYIK
ncbi:MAG: hypothetical protein PHD97_10540 [Bacteroidales bacterium]|nr:hypothetical protein [Bacteroidales bacterium]